MDNMLWFFVFERNKMILDKRCSEEISEYPNSRVGWVVMSSYLYYTKDDQLISDYLFDSLCKWLFDNWDNVEHKWKKYLTKEGMKVGSLYNLKKEDYPPQIEKLIQGLVLEA